MMEVTNNLLRAFRWALWLSLVYGGLSLAWSAFGLLTPTAPVHLHEYPLKGLLVEVGGHVLFGLAAGIATLDPALAMLCGGEAILIDTDHLLGAVNLPVQTRLSHSLGFMVVGSLIVGRLAKRKMFWKSVALVTFASVLSHLSYDIFAGNAPVPLLGPLSATFYALPSWTWLPLEGGAFAICGLAGFYARMKRRPSGLKAIKEQEGVGTR